MAGNQVGKCASISSLIDTPAGRKRIGDIFGSECEVLTWPDRSPRRVLRWIRKPAEECYRLVMADGQWIEAPGGHQILTDVGYVSVSTILSSLQKYGVYRPQSTLVLGLTVRASSVQNFYRRIRDYLDGCSLDYRLGDAQLLEDREGVQVFAPLPNDVLRHSRIVSCLGGLANRCKRSLQQAFSRLSSFCVAPQIWGRFFCYADQVCAYGALRRTLSNGISERSSTAERPQRSAGEAFVRQSLVSASVVPVDEGNKIIEAYSVGVKDLYDMEVEERHNYIAGGLVNHNTLAGAMEGAIHLTGRYPAWWKGNRFTRPIHMLVGGLTNESVRDICQKELFGDPNDDKQLGYGTIPIDAIGKTTRKAGVPNALDTVQVRHLSGLWSKVSFRAYEQGAKKHMGSRIDLGWLDEEPPEDIWSQYIRGTLSTRGILYITFTPEEGVTKVVYGFINDLKPGQALVRATWDDAPHMNHDRREQLLMAIPPHQREMREKGVPLMGSGLVYGIPEDEIVCEPIEIPNWWPRICAIDPGIDHAFAAVWLAWDRDRDIVYAVDAYKKSGEKVSEHVSQLNRRGNWIPVIWPADALSREKSSGKPLSESYREEGANTWHEPFSNPPTPGVEEGKGGNSVEYGIEHILHRMQTGRFKVFRTLASLLDEIRMYHREDGKIVKQFDDLMDAMRYACLSLRHATTPTFKIKRVEPPRGAVNW